jgi:SPP1 family predicted phage head-tail adaptor
MTNRRPYRRTEKTGNLDTRVVFYTPTYQRDVLGSERPKWVLWKTVWSEVMPAGGDEEFTLEKTTARRKRKFRVRFQSIPGVNETMKVRSEGDDYDILHIENDPDELTGTFKIITAERLAENITPVTVLDNNMAMDYSQTFTNQTGTTVTVTAGSLPDPATYAADYFHQMVFVFRGGGNMVRAVYGTGYTVSGNTITFTEKLRGENVLVHQYQLAGS